MNKKFNTKFFGSEIIEGLYCDYLGDESWERYVQAVLDEELKRNPNLFTNIGCPEGVPEDICEICFAWWGGMGWVDDSFGYLFDNYTVMEVLQHCKHGEIIVRSGLQNLHW